MAKICLIIGISFDLNIGEPWAKISGVTRALEKHSALKKIVQVWDIIKEYL
jgi:hypothetical protein